MNQFFYKEHSIFSEQLPQPNPLQKKSLKAPFSIFSLLQLPDFTYSQQETPLLTPKKELHSSIGQRQTRTRSNSIRKKLNKASPALFLVEETELKILFEDPLYLYSKRLSRESNKNFCNLRVFPQESQDHASMKDNKNQFFNSNLGDQNLSFESRFECGNLGIATKSKLFDNEYYLLLTKDFNTARCTQWFFFRVLNKKKSRCTFHILNFFKNYSSFEYGMQPCVAARSWSYKWVRKGSKIEYRQTNIRNDQRPMHSLSFTYDFEQDQDVTYFSYSYPYSYSKLDKFLFELEAQRPDIVKRKPIGQSLGRNSIDLLTITNFKVSSNLKKIVFITARIHPGQTPSSFVMEGIIRQLTEQTSLMQNARQKFIFKLIPMLNPDGVINGNYRCSLSGNDLNRIWNKCIKEKFPQIYFVKKAIETSKKPFLFIDLHAHSKKKGAFMYGCSLKNNPFLSRQIPFLLWKHINQFNYFQCNFSTSNQQREGTARITIFKQIGVPLSYTMEHSFCGPLKVRNHFTAENFIRIGKDLVKIIQRFYGKRNEKNQHQIDDFLKELYANKELIKIGDQHSNQSSSDSELEAQFQIDLEENKKNKKRLNQSKHKLNFISPVKQMAVRTPRECASSSVNFTQFKAASEINIPRQKNIYVEVSKIGFNHDLIFKSSSPRRQSPDLCKILKKEDNDDQTNRPILKPAIRYSDEDINNLTNLFLPSVTSNSYKKYHKAKPQNKNIVHVGRKFLENAGILKDQIKSVLKKKIQLRIPAKSMRDS